MRSFLAFDLPVPLIDLINGVQNRLRAEYPDLRWVKRENLHLTLHFLGDTSLQAMDGIAKECGYLALKHSAFPVRPSRLGVFPRWQAPAVLWLSLTGELETINRLYSGTASIIKKMGLKPENRPFSPHITLARVPAGHREGFDRAKIENYSIEDNQQFLLSVFTLYTSELRPQGPVYSPYSRFELNNPSSGGEQSFEHKI